MEEMLRLLGFAEEELTAFIERLKSEGRLGITAEGKEYIKSEMAGFQMASFGEFNLQRAEIKELAETAGIKFKDGMEDRVKRFRGSDETPDRHGDIIRVNGWDLKNYKKNPVFQWAHDYYMPPLGNSIKTSKITDDKKKLLEFLILFASPEVYEFAETIHGLYDSGFLKACSVGFYPKKIVRVDDEKERTSLGLGKYGVVYEKQELLELSGCSIGANPNALQNSIFKKAFKESLIEENKIKSLVESINLPYEFRKTLADTWNEFDEERSIIITNTIDIKPKMPEDINTNKTGNEPEGKPGVEDKPEWTEIRYRVKNPNLFDDGSFKRVAFKKDKPRIFAIIGKLKGEKNTTLQALRFPKGDDWTKAKVKKWVDDHKGDIKSFEDVIGKMPDIIETFMLNEKYFEEAEQRAGAVLNKKNKELLRMASENVLTVLKNAGESDGDDDGKSMFDILNKVIEVFNDSISNVHSEIDERFKSLEDNITETIKLLIYSEEIKQFLQDKSGGSGNLLPDENTPYLDDLLDTANETKQSFNKENNE